MNARIMRWVRSSADYIQGRQRRERFTNKGADRSDVLRTKLRRAERKLKEAERELRDVYSQILLEDLSAFDEALPRIARAREATIDAFPAMHDALAMMPAKGPGRTLRDQRAAVQLAEAMVTDGEVRRVARQIMMEAGIKEPSPEAITKWLKEIREWDGK